MRVRRQVERHALPDQGEAANHGRRQKDPKQRSYEVHPEVAHGSRTLPGEASDEGDSQGKAGRAGEEVLRDQTKQLGQVAKSSFAAISLRGCGCRETDRSVGRQVRGHWRGQVTIGGAAGEQALSQQQKEQACRAYGAEEQEAPRVVTRGHLLACVNPQPTVEKRFRWAEYGIKEGALPLENPGQIEAHRLSQSDDEC